MNAANAGTTMGIPEAQWMKLIHSPSWVSVISKTGKTQYLKHEVPYLLLKNCYLPNINSHTYVVAHKIWCFICGKKVSF